MADTQAYLEVYLTGGASNTDPLLSLGGVKSSTAIRGQTTTALSNVTGVTIIDGHSNTAGAGTLTYTNTGQTLTWTDSVGAAGAPVDVSTDGRYVIASAGGGALYVAVVAASLPGADQSDSVTVANSDQALFDNWTIGETWAGTAEYLCVAILGVAGMPDNAWLSAWIDSDTTGADTLAIGWDATFNGSAVTIADINTAPAGVVFSAPTDQPGGEALTPGDLGTTGKYGNLWVRRTVPSNTGTATAVNISALRFGVRVL